MRKLKKIDSDETVLQLKKLRVFVGGLFSKFVLLQRHEE